MNSLQIKEEVNACRQQWPILSIDKTPIDILTFLELELGLDIIPAPGIQDAALARDFCGIYVNENAYSDLNRVPPWMTRRLRFTLAHEFAHWYLHRTRAPSGTFRCVRDMLICLRTANGSLEWEADEFAGQLLVPAESLRDAFRALSIRPDQMTPAARLHFCRRLEPVYGVSCASIGIRLDRERLWPSW